MNHVIRIFSSASSEARKAVRKLAGRWAELERFDHHAFHATTRKAFGRDLRPHEVVSEVLAGVRRSGDRALLRYARLIDGVSLDARSLRVSAAERRAAMSRISPALRSALELSAARITDYQMRLMPRDVQPAATADGPAGVRSGLFWTPIQRAGLYVPAGTAPLFSSLAMLAVPALVAGVKEIAVCSPCDRQGRVNDGILCACEILGLKEIYKLGGAQAIAALAYGTKTIPAVDLIAGPGNLFVMLAKRAVFGHVNIDGLFGPSEVLILADSSASPRYIAADLLAQAEHDVLASCVLLTDSRKLAENTAAELSRQLESLPRKKIAAAALRDWGLILVTPSLDRSIELANQLAPEHLELMTRNPQRAVKRLATSGAIFVGPHATEPLGDYLAGPSHTLPTGGTARAFSGVSVYTFLRRTSIIEADAAGLAELSGAVATLAEAEGLEAHRRAVAMRSTRQNSKGKRQKW